MTTLPQIPYDTRQHIIDEYLRRVGPFEAMKQRLQVYNEPWARQHIEVIDATVRRIMANIAREHGLDTIEGI